MLLLKTPTMLLERLGFSLLCLLPYSHWYVPLSLSIKEGVGRSTTAPCTRRISHMFIGSGDVSGRYDCHDSLFFPVDRVPGRTCACSVNWRNGSSHCACELASFLLGANDPFANHTR